MRGFTALEAVIDVQIARGSQRLVIQIDGAGHLLQFFAEQVNRLQLAGRGGSFKFGGLQELLVAAVQQPGHLASHQRSGPKSKSCRRAVLSLGWVCGRHQNCPGPVLTYQHAACDSGPVRHIEGMCAQGLQNLVKIWIA